MLPLTTSVIPLLFLFPFTISSSPLPPPNAEIGQPCGASLGDCPTLTCIPVSKSCTNFRECQGTCHPVNISEQQIYTKCGGWGFMDDCNEKFESCIADPRTDDKCGPSCDGMGICWPFMDYCGWEDGRECAPGSACFKEERAWPNASGVCLPLRFGSDYYEKTNLEEIFRNDQDGWQGEEW